MPNNSLKELNKKSIWILIVFDIVLFMVILKDMSFSFLIDSFFTEKSIVSPLLASVLGPLIAGTLNGFIPSRIKDNIVFWKMNNVLPGHRAFSKRVYADPRIDAQKLESQLGGFPIKEREQNAKWYSLYKKHRGGSSIDNSHQSFLLYRDFTVITFLLSFIVCGLSFVLNLGMYKFFQILVICIFQYFAFMIIARNMGNRFVDNVLAEEFSDR